MELFLAKVVGMYLLIVGCVVLARQRSIMPAISELAQSKALLMVLAFIELAAGLSLIVAYPTIDVSVAGLLALIGYIMVIEAIVYMALPSAKVRKMVGHFNRPAWYVSGGLASIVLGGYLVAISFGLVQ